MQNRARPGSPAIAIMASLMVGAAATGRAQDCNVLEVNTTNAAATPHVCAFDPVKNAAAGTKIRHVLLYDWSNGGHDKTHTQKHMMRLAKKYGFRLDRSHSMTYITPATLQGVDIVVINNSDQDAFQNATSLAAMRDFIENQGKALLGIHAAAAYIPCPSEDLSGSGCRWIFRAYGAQYWNQMEPTSTSKARIYADSVMPGSIPPNAWGVDSIPATIPHGRKNAETRNIFENLPVNGPAGPLANRPYIWDGLWDSWFNYRNHPRRHNAAGGTNYGIADGPVYGPINILLSIDETSIPLRAHCNWGSPCKTGDRPVSWTRKVGNGLAAYNNAGRGDVYHRERFVPTDTVREFVPRSQSHFDSVLNEFRDTIVLTAEGDTVFDLVERPVGVSVRDSLMEKYNWRLMKYLARDFVGCMDPASPRYNPEATVTTLTAVDDPDPCDATTNVSSGAARPAVATVTARAGVIRVTLQGGGRHVISIGDVAGRRVRTRIVEGATRANLLEFDGLGPGIYFVRVTAPGGATTTARADLL